ncbi:hypothetical protein ACFV0T_26685 [Streptomyces sp. NPDC059582]|uniref:hypothetical protein n=1 Tax=Streptomyces sp. NPDC059582 TaxID=3346875 RepID=UPI00368CFD88
MNYNQNQPSSSEECACEAERLLNQANQTNDVGVMTRRIAAADVWARLAQAAAVRETAARADER